MLAYIIQMLLCAALLYGYYHLFLRNERFHQYNRYYLLSVMVLSLTLPLLNIPLYFTGKDTENILIQSLGAISVLKAEPVIVVSSKPSVPVITVDTILYIFYVAISLFLFIKIVMAIRKIYKLRAAHQKELIDDIEFIATNHPETPFSFFKWLFWNNNIPLNSDKGQQVFKHELYHIQKRHSWDLLFTELMLALCWFNPFFYFIRNEIKVIQEFLADKYATNEENTSAYAELLLMQAFGTYDKKLVNPFFHNQLKRRITMLTSSKKPAYQYLRKLMVLPVVAVAIMLFAFTYKKEIKGVKKNVDLKVESISNMTNELSAINKQKPDTIKPKESFDFLKSDTLVVYNGNVIPQSEVSKIPIDSIRTLTVLTKKIAMEKYGEKGKHGAIILSSSVTKQLQENKEVISNDAQMQHNEVIIVSYNALKQDQPEEEKLLIVAPYSFDGGNEPVFTETETSAAYPGSDRDWKTFLERNIRGDAPIKGGAKAGIYRTVVQFVVEKDGTISNIKPLVNQGYGIEEEVMRVLKKSVKWKPAMQNGHEVRSVYKQYVTFQLYPKQPPKES